MITIPGRKICEKRNYQCFRQTCNESSSLDGVLFFAAYSIHRRGEYFFVHVPGRRFVMVARFFHRDCHPAYAAARDSLWGGIRCQHFTLLQFCCGEVGRDTVHVTRRAEPGREREPIIERVACAYKPNMILSERRN